MEFYLLLLPTFFSKIGSSENIKAGKTIKDLINEFSFAKLSKSTVQYDYKELLTTNTKVIHSLSFDEIKNDLVSLNLKDVDEEFWLSIRSNINVFEDLKFWYKVCKQDIKTEIVNKELY